MHFWPYATRARFLGRGAAMDERVKFVARFLKQEKPTRGAPKIMEFLARRYPDAHCPANSAIHEVRVGSGDVFQHAKRLIQVNDRNAQFWELAGRFRSGK